ncbi:MAG: DUF262 domain-containing protein [Spirochaetia bacterium]|nr:DUF262 domain-containing protein [Spirochaetia bacterium]
MSLQEEIDLKAKTIKSDGYSMSIGELASMYKEGEMDIHPDFQRLYRWNDEQKTKLIESILLGIPIPSIFVAQREDGIWDVIDGLQRLSTIFQFMGILKNDKDELYEPLKLLKTNYLPSLENKMWESENDEESFTMTQRLIIKRAKIDIKIITRESDSESKYELFQRLNTNGSSLSDQEIRNCLLLMINKDFYHFIDELSKDNNFLNTISITEKSTNESYDKELVLRFFIYRYCQPEDISRRQELGSFITEKMIQFAQDSTFDKEREGETFRETFKLLNDTLGDDVFRKYSKDTGKFIGPFSISAYECIIPAVSKKYNVLKKEKLKESIINMWNNTIFIDNSGAGLRAADRVKKLIPLGTILFS